MCSICGIDCSKCSLSKTCAGCEKTCGKPFGGECVAEKYITAGGKKAYLQFKMKLLNEINQLLFQNGLPQAENLCELNGAYVNLEYNLPNGEKAKFLDDKKIYLGCQIEVADLDVCFGVVADTNFIVVSSYFADGKNPQLLIYKQR